MSLMIVKKMDKKSAVWFERSNQYLMLDPFVASAVERIYNQENNEDLALELMNKHHVPREKAMDFISDLKEKLVFPNTAPKRVVQSDLKKHEIPDKFAFTTYYQIHSKVFKVECTTEFEYSLTHPKIAHLEVSNECDFDHTATIFSNGKTTLLYLDNELIGSWSREEIHYFEGKFLMKIIEYIYEKPEDNWMGVFHASALSYKKDTILFLGGSGSGKSTSLALLQAHGFHCVADDFVPIDNDQLVHSFPAGISIKENSLETLLPYYPTLRSAAEYHYERLNKTVRYIPPKNTDYNTRYQCKALIFIKYDKHIDFEIKPISNMDAFEYLVPDSWISQNANNVAVFLEWFSLLPCYQLNYSNNEKMIAKVGRLFKNGL